MAGYQKQRQREYFAVELQVSEERGAIGLAGLQPMIPLRTTRRVLSTGYIPIVNQPAENQNGRSFVNTVACPIELFFHPFHSGAIL